VAEVILKNIKKIYPFTEDEKKKDKKDESEEKPMNLQITDKGVVAVQDFNLEIADKEFVVLVGPSGCGKSTTLRMIAGLEDISEGDLYIDGERMNDVAPKNRDIAMVFQNYALYPHMTVYENMAFSLKMQKFSKEEIDKHVREAADILDITPLLNRKPKALSGGQRQRVAMGRAFVRDPKVFLMDEPLSNLDAKLRNQMRAEIIKLRKKIDTTFIYVTHDQVEAMTLGDRIVIMKDGYIQQIGTPQDVFNNPKNLFVAGFIGVPQMNFFPGSKLRFEGGKYIVEILGESFELPDKLASALGDGEEVCGSSGERDVVAGVRPVNVVVSDDGTGIDAVVEVAEMMGSEMHLHMKASGAGAADTEIIAVVPTLDLDVEQLGTGTHLKLNLQTEAMHLFDAETEQSLLG